MSRLNPFSTRVPTQDKINFVRHLAMIIKAGVPMFDGLRIIQRQTESKVLKKIIERIIIDVTNGRFLADSLESHKKLFNHFFVSIIRVGEASGTLATNLLYLADEMEKSKDLRNKVRAALIYPVIVLVMTIVIVGLLMFFVFPKVIPVLQGLNVPLPLPTRILIGFSQFLTQYGFLVLGAIVLLALLGRFVIWKLQPVQYAAYRLAFLVPVFSSLTVDLSMANFSRVLGILLKSGSKIVESLETTSRTFDNLVYRRYLQQAADQMRKGEEFARTLEKYPQVFPPLLSGLIEVGERTGNLQENLEYLAEYYSKEAEVKVQGLTTVLEPLLLLFMGLVVGFVAISIIVPIYQISSGFGGN